MAIKNLIVEGDSIKGSHGYVDIGTVNDHQIKIAVNTDPFPWHRHPNSEELFIVTQGKLTIEFEDGVAVSLLPNDTFVVPKGKIHRTVPHGRTVNLLVEHKGTETLFIGDDDASQ